MSNINTIMEKLILGMRDGEDLDEILKDEVGTDLTRSIAKDLAQHIVELYDGKFPIDHLSVGDICIDAFGCMPCIITNINEKTIHVLYFNGKAYKFRKYQEGQFKKLGPNLKKQLALFMDDCQLFAKTSMEIKSPSKLLSEKIKKGPGYDFPIATSKEDVE